MSICFTIADADWALTKDVFSVIGTVVSAIGVGLVAWVGFSGLATWRQQTKGTSDHDLARRLLIDLYRLRDAIGHVRNPLILASEGGPEERDAKLSFPQISYRSTVRAYEQRFSVVDEVRRRLDTSLIESEAVWDTTVKKLFGRIFNLQHELFINIRTYLVTLNPDERDQRVEACTKILEKRREVMYGFFDDSDDPFKADLDAALSKIEDYLRPKLIR